MNGYWNPGLTFLLRKRASARLRLVCRSCRSIRGAFATLAGLAFFGFWLLGFFLTGAVSAELSPEKIRNVVPVATLMFTLMNTILTRTDTGIVFSRFETAWLFPGPFTRRQILVYRTIGNLLSITPIAILMSLMLSRYSNSWIGGFLAVWHGFWFLQSVQLLLALITAAFEEGLVSRGRRIFIGLTVVGLAWLLGDQFGSQSRFDFESAASALRSSTIGSVILLPFEPFGQLMAADSGAMELWLWAALLLAFNLLLTGVLIRLDANFLESSLAASERLQRKIARFQRGGLANMRSAEQYRSRHLPKRFFRGGAGALIWRQSLTAIRSSRSFVIMIGIASLALVVPLLLSPDGVKPDTQLIVFLATISVIFLPQMIRLDFRSELDRMDVIKFLPITPLRMVIGELTIPILLTTVLQWSVLLGICAVRQQLSREVVTFLAFTVPLNILVFGMENLLFLLYPYRLPAAGIADLQAFIRHSLITALKLLLITAVASISVGSGAFVFWLTSSKNLFAVTAWIVAMGCNILLLPLLCLSLQRYDPSQLHSES